MAIDRSTSYKLGCSPPIPSTEANLVCFSDGAVRGATGNASASWAIFAVRRTHVHLVSGGAKLLGSGTTSLQAEVGLRLAMEHINALFDPIGRKEDDEEEPVICLHELRGDILARSLESEKLHI